MTKEQGKAIEIISKYLNFNEICGTRNFKEALETVLNILKEKDKKIEKKDKIIDLIINTVYKRFKAELLLEYGFENAEQFKQYFERKK